MIRVVVERLRFRLDHRFTQRHLSEYVDGELEPPGRARVESHVGVCPQCRRVLATLNRMLRSLRELGTESRPGLAAGIVERLHHPR
ncbi:MAG TPA: zf-HC2 domain-containing protein [Thermoleophilaceae bacterium]|nr:zf-HC2 domain-containing protein [Thermoleophilaceae bacterium]